MWIITREAVFRIVCRFPVALNAFQAIGHNHRVEGALNNSNETAAR